MTIPLSIFRFFVRAALLLLLPVAVCQAQDRDNAAAYALANQVADELELVRERMGRPFDDSPRLPVSAVSELELYYQTQSLLRKANQLAQELAGAAPRAPGPVPSGEISSADVYALLEDALGQIRVAAEAIGIMERATFEQRVTSIAATGVFLVVIDINRQLNQMLRVPIGNTEVFEEVSAAITSAAALLATYPGTTPVPEPPPFDGYKRPADVYQRLTECMDAVIRVAPKVGVPVLGLSVRRNVPEDTEPGHAYDIARFLVADLAAFADARDVPRVRVSLPVPKHVFPTEVYAHAGILLRQLEQLEQRL
ncbi:MAG TPA: hypothetical protein VLI71_04435 [Gammaproteobacteria bacterium]|nr:hypothetical protein [Gammaproteobacteria bacterium]